MAVDEYEVVVTTADGQVSKWPTYDGKEARHLASVIDPTLAQVSVLSREEEWVEVPFTYRGKEEAAGAPVPD